MKNKRYILIAGGHLNVEFVKKYMDDNPRWKASDVICIDRGLDCARNLGFIPKIIVGDFDSVKKCELDWWRQKEKEGKTRFLSLKPEKDLTDTHAALLEALADGPEEILILGATGGRIDHFLGNLNLLILPMKEKVKAWILDEQNRICISDHGFIIKKEECFGKYISFISLTKEVTGLTLKGFKYETEGITLKRGDSLGISNEIMADAAQLVFLSGVLIIVESGDTFY